MNYKQTLNVTLNDKDPGAMPQRAGLAVREPEVQAYWDEIDLYARSVEKPAAQGTFVLHDGPPYSNGDIHLGHALNKIAKDIIVKHRSMLGFRAPYVPGWDNHGMPIENEVAKEFRSRGESPDRVTMRKRCREYAAGFVDRQREQFKRLGVRGDWDNPYLTMSPDFESAIVSAFGELAEKGCVYRGLKPVLWCGSCETALADAEVEYENHTSNSIYVQFPVLRDPAGVFGRAPENPEGCSVVIWTTTPWTIPANLALAVHPDEEYVVIDLHDRRYLAANRLSERVSAVVAPGDQPRVIWQGRGSELEGLIAQHPLVDRPSPVVMANYVTMEDGTGVVHTAPGHGKEDFETGVRYGLEILCPVGPNGAFTRQAGAQFEGKRIRGGEADEAVLDALRQTGHLLQVTKFDHSYPHCWRCHSPLIFRATVQWFMSIDHETNGTTHRQQSLQAIQQVAWHPPVSINRISSMVANRPDWCLSRQRAWGVGIPAFYCRDCGKEILSREAIDHVAGVIAEETSDAWYALSTERLLPPGFTCPHCGGTHIDKETDILDVWFDSGSSQRAVLENKEKWPLLQWPADVYLEGSDQHRGWFNSSLMVAVGTRGSAPYRSVITNGWTLDETGKAMHKSLGNTVSPAEVIAKHGADILRLWVASTDYFEDVRCSDNILVQVSETYRRIRNTFRFLVNNLYVSNKEERFDPQRHGVAAKEMPPLDLWVLARLDQVVATCGAGYNDFEFHRIYHAVNGFCAVELSAFYLDVIKDRLYCSAADSVERRSALTAIHTIAETLARLLAPILSFTAEEVWGYLGRPSGAASPQLADFPTPSSQDWAETISLWEPILAARETVNLAIEAARQDKSIVNPLEARVDLIADGTTHDLLASMTDALPAIFKVSQVTVQRGAAVGQGLRAAVTPAVGAKCARCWLVKEDVGAQVEYPDLCTRCAEVVRLSPGVE